MQRILEGTQPMFVTSFYNYDNEAEVPTSIFYSVIRADTNQLVVTPTNITPAQTIRVVLPPSGSALDPADRDPVIMVYSLGVRFAAGNNYQEEVRYAVVPTADSV